MMSYLKIGTLSCLFACGFVVSCADSDGGAVMEVSSEDAVFQAASPAPMSSSIKPSATNSTNVAQKQRQKPAVKEAEITVVSIEHLFELQQAGVVYLLDCRPSFFYRMGHINGASNLPLKKFESQIKKRQTEIEGALKADLVVVVYCQNIKCPDAYGVAKKLSQRGYPVTIYKGGWDEWKKSGL